MKILVDDKPFFGPLRPGTLAQTLEVIGGMIYANDRGITRIVLDGSPMALDESDEEALTRPVSEYGTIEIYTESTMVMLRQDLDNVGDLLKHLPEMCLLLAQAFPDIGSDEGREHYYTLEVAWSNIEDCHIAAAQYLGKDLAELEFMNTNAQAHRAIVGEKLAAASKAFMKEDWVAFSDMLQYDLAELADAETELTVLLYRLVCEETESAEGTEAAEGA